jgi:hypothetical protein
VNYKIWCLCVVALVPITTRAQRKINDHRLFQFSLTPGLSTNGLHPGGFTNYFSFNLTSGYAESSMFLEIGGISNLNEHKTRGLQIGGLANLTGANAYAGMNEKEKELKIKSGFEANLTGLQVSGLTNIVINHVFGGQISGGVNIAKGALMGVQVSGLSNIVHKYSFGLQLAGLWNSSVQSMDGFQLSGLMNYTKGELYGVQISSFNKAGYIEGKNSYENDKPTGVQIGLVNAAKKMNGFQIGLINYAKRSQGTQIGLINIYRGGKDVGTRDGTAIGLINVGDVFDISAYADELFFTNYEISTGTRKNRRIKDDLTNKNIVNSLIFSNSSNGFISDQKSWALGYGLKKFYYSRSDSPGMAEFRFFSFGAELLHVNYEAKKFTSDMNLLVRPKVSVGTRLHRKVTTIYVFGALTYNFYWTEGETGISPRFMEASKKVSNKLLEMWPGLSFGIHLHG